MENCTLLPTQTPPSEETLCHLHAQLGDLNDSELQQLIKDLSQEIAQCELTVPLSNPLLMTGYIHQAVESLRKMTRGHLSRRGKVGSREANHPSSKFTSWGKSSLWTTAAIAMSCNGRTRYGATNHCPDIGSVNQHPKNKHL